MAARTTKKTTKKSAPRQTKAVTSAKKQMWAVVLFAVGLFVLALTFISGARLWLGLHNFLFGLFGISSYFIAPFVIYIAVIAAMDKPLSSIKAKLWQMGLLVVLISGLVQIFGSGLPSQENLVENAIALYEEGRDVAGGGVASALFAVPLILLFDKTGASIIIVLLIFVFVMILTGSSLLSLIRAARKPVEGLEQVYAARAEERQQKKESKARFNIDVDISGDAPIAPEPELPQHPVVAPADSKQRLLNLAQDKPVEFISADEFPAPEVPAPPPAPAPERAHPLDDEITESTPEEIEEIVHRFVGAKQQADTPPWEEPAGFSAAEVPATTTPATPLPVPERPAYTPPPVSLLQPGAAPASGDISEELKNNAQTLVDTLKSFGVQTRITEISRGPAVTRYELQPSAGVKISKITGLADDIALNLASAGIRIEAPIPNKAAVGIEVPNKVISTVHIRDIIEAPAFQDAHGVLNVALGKDIAGNTVIGDIGTMPHVLIAGSTGSGKSVCINSIILSLLYKYTPDEVKLIMVDPKVVELGVYNGVPHLMVPVVTDPKKAAGTLGWAVSEMMKRYQTFAANGVKDLGGYNRLAGQPDSMDPHKPDEKLLPMPKIVIIIDELADLMMAASNEVEDHICRLAQMARAAGMHLVIATQRPSVDVITGVIKANIPSRVAFAVSSMVDSRTILDMGGAEKLLGRGDMLFYPVGMSKPLRVQGCFVTEREVEDVVGHIKQHLEAEYDENLVEEMARYEPTGKTGNGRGAGDDDNGSDEDEMLPAAIECVVEAGQASTSLLQRRLKLGYARAARIIDQLEQKGVVGPFEGSKPRQVLISKERWLEMKLSANTFEPHPEAPAAPEPVPEEIL